MKRRGQIQTTRINNSRARIFSKGQIQMTETVAVIFIFFILVVFGIIFYAKYQEGNLAEKREELFIKRAIDTSIKTLFMPEFICTRGEAEPEKFCLDLMKVRGAAELLKDDYYFDIFSYAKITVQEVYPPGEEVVLYDRVLPNSTKSTPTFFTITLKDEAKSLNGQALYKYGVLKVEIFG